MEDEIAPASPGRLLSAALAGDASGIDQLHAVPRPVLVQAAKQIGTELLVDRAALLRVLRDWRSGKVTEEQVRWWAIFLFLGAFPQAWAPAGWHATYSAALQPLDIEYSNDDVVNEIVFRLKDLGDSIDGVIGSEERDRMIDKLAAS